MSDKDIKITFGRPSETSVEAFLKTASETVVKRIPMHSAKTGKEDGSAGLVLHMSNGDYVICVSLHVPDMVRDGGVPPDVFAIVHNRSWEWLKEHIDEVINTAISSFLNDRNNETVH